jgi:hypothetical protein
MGEESTGGIVMKKKTSKRVPIKKKKSLYWDFNNGSRCYFTHRHIDYFKLAKYIIKKEEQITPII